MTWAWRKKSSLQQLRYGPKEVGKKAVACLLACVTNMADEVLGS